MLYQRAATETFDENWTFLSTTTKQQQAMKTGPPGYLYTHTHTHATTHAQSHIVQHTNTHTLHSSRYISSTYTHWRRLEHVHAHTLKTYLTYKCLHSRAQMSAFMHVYTHMQMLITQYTHAARCASYARIHTHTHTNKQTRARMHTLRNTENYNYHIRRK